MKTIKIMLIALFIMLILTHNVLAIGVIIGRSENWAVIGNLHTSKTIHTPTLMDISGGIYNLLLGIATAVAIIVGSIIGIQFMTAGINKRVEVKQTLYPYLISCIVVFGSLGIWKLVVNVMSKV